MANTATTGIMNASIFSTFDAGKPQIERDLTARYGTQFESSFMKLMRTGREMPIAADGWSAYEDNRYHETITTTGTISYAIAGAAVYFTINTTMNPTTSDFYLKPTDVIMWPGTDILLWCESIDVSAPEAPIATMLPFNSGDQPVPVDITADTVLAIVGQASGQGTDQPLGSVLGFQKRDFKLQIIKGTSGLDGSQYANELWFEIYDNGSVVGWFTTGTLRMEYNFKRNMDGAFMVGYQSTNTDLVQERVNIHGIGIGTNSTVNTTDGLLPLIRSRGNTEAVVSETYALTDLDDIGLYLRTQATTSGIVWTPGGARIYNDIQNECKDYVIDGGADGALVDSVLVNLAKGNKDVATSLNFTNISRGNWTYMLDIVENWSDSKTFNATGYDFDTKILYLPLKKVRDSKSGESLDNLAVGYRAMGGYSRKTEVWGMHGAGGTSRHTYTTSVDRSEFYMRGECGLQAMAVNQFTLGEV